MKIARLVSREVVGPMWDHDCEDCTFLGRLDQTDLYSCPNDKSLIARYSSISSDNGAWGADWGIPPVGSRYALARIMLYKDLPPRAYRTVQKLSN